MTAKKNSDIILKALNVTKRFSGVKALDAVSLEIYRGEVNAVIGENGAGKSTLMNIFCGVYNDYEGKVFLNNEEIRFDGPKQAQQKGISVIHQELNLIPDLSIAENIFLGREFTNLLGFINYRKLYSETKKLLRMLELNTSPKTKIKELKVGQQQIVEIARAVSFDSQIIIMDEPTSAISDHEADILFSLIDRLKKRNVSVIYITHKLEELEKIADKVVVLRDGRLIHTCAMEYISRDEIIRMMVGREINEFYLKENSKKGYEILRVNNLSLQNPFTQGSYVLKNISFSLNKGEILGIFGLMGAGRTELMETIFGMYPNRMKGNIFIDDKPVSIKHPADGKRYKLALVPEDRKLNGLVLQMKISENISLAGIENIEKNNFISHARELRLAGYYIEELQIKARSPAQVVENLSGGNQQKVVIAKWLATNPEILLLDEPTRGIDINAKNQIYKLIGHLVKQGMGIILVSSELPEVLAISDRILVMSEGTVTAELSREEANEENIMKAALSKTRLASAN